MEEKTLATITRKCRTCKRLFTIDEEHANWFISRGLEQPTHCPACREKNKLKRQEQEYISMDAKITAKALGEAPFYD